MKIRNHRKRAWLFVPHKDSKLKEKGYKFKYKSDLMSFLNRHFENALNGEVWLEEDTFNSSGYLRMWFVWYNDYAEENQKDKIVLKQQLFRGRKYIFKPSKISKSAKKYFAFSNKVGHLMCNIEDEKNNLSIHPKDAKRLIELFHKRGFKDFVPTEEEQEYIDQNIKEGIPFFYWSDRCNFLRCKTILEYFKQEKLI